MIGVQSQPYFRVFFKHHHRFHKLPLWPWYERHNSLVKECNANVHHGEMFTKQNSPFSVHSKCPQSSSFFIYFVQHARLKIQSTRIWVLHPHWSHSVPFFSATLSSSLVSLFCIFTDGSGPLFPNIKKGLLFTSPLHFIHALSIWPAELFSNAEFLSEEEYIA